MIHEPINITGPGVSVVVAAQRGFSILVLSYLLVSSAAAQVDFEDNDGNILSGPYSVGTAGGNIAGYSPEGNFRVQKGKGLNLGVDAAVQVGGHIAYKLIYEG
jgi:hypothetical protein